MNAVAPAQVVTDVPLPRSRKQRDPETFKPGAGGPRRAATVAIRELANAAIGASVFVKSGTYAFDHEAIRTAARRAGGSGWYTVREVEGGWRIWKKAPISA